MMTLVLCALLVGMPASSDSRREAPFAPASVEIVRQADLAEICREAVRLHLVADPPRDGKAVIADPGVGPGWRPYLEGVDIIVLSSDEARARSRHHASMYYFSEITLGRGYVTVVLLYGDADRADGKVYRFTRSRGVWEGVYANEDVTLDGTCAPDSAAPPN